MLWPMNPEPRSYENTIQVLDDITQGVSEGLTPIHHLLSVAETPELREAFNSVLPEIAQFWSRLPLNDGLWNQVKAFDETPEAKALGGNPCSPPGEDPSGVPAGWRRPSLGAKESSRGDPHRAGEAPAEVQ